jgi:hypothetical protein
MRCLPDGTRRRDLICDRAIEFVNSQLKDQPFCLNL